MHALRSCQQPLPAEHYPTDTRQAAPRLSRSSPCRQRFHVKLLARRPLHSRRARPLTDGPTIAGRKSCGTDPTPAPFLPPQPSALRSRPCPTVRAAKPGRQGDHSPPTRGPPRWRATTPPTLPNGRTASPALRRPLSRSHRPVGAAGLRELRRRDQPCASPATLRARCDSRLGSDAPPRPRYHDTSATHQALCARGLDIQSAPHP